MSTGGSGGGSSFRVGGGAKDIGGANRPARVSDVESSEHRSILSVGLSSSLDRDDPLFIRCLYSRSFHSLTSLIFSSLCLYSS